MACLLVATLGLIMPVLSAPVAGHRVDLLVGILKLSAWKIACCLAAALEFNMSVSPTPGARHSSRAALLVGILSVTACTALGLELTVFTRMVSLLTIHTWHLVVIVCVVVPRGSVLAVPVILGLAAL